ncbi:MAG: amidohydrolase family protein [Labilithrix sp.]|nr:amidohydrolase family protein [Labilithrix sp.]
MDTILEGGLFFDGTGAAASVRNVGIEGGRVVAVSAAPLPKAAHTRTIDARGRWVTPGFLDMHTHYDAEVEVAPGLVESVRHGVTTCVLGSCSLSLALGSPEDLADQFCRVEAIPYGAVRAILEERKTWDCLPGYLDHLSSLPLGPNVASFIGHSALRVHAMGMERALSRVKPTARELGEMDRHVAEGLDAGYLGLSIQTLPWDKIGGSRDVRSRPLPSTFARWSEYRRFARQLRARGRILQGVPNVTTKLNVFLFLLESAGLVRKPLKTTIISMMDTLASRGIHRFAGVLSRAFNRLFGAAFRWQALPEPFELWADGMDVVVFEELGAGAEALHLEDLAARRALLADPRYRSTFRRQFRSKLAPKIFHRNLRRSTILDAPDPSVVGKTFSDVARERGVSSVDAFLDLVGEHGDALRWYTVMANDRPRELERIVAHPDVLIGFSDAGAHLRNMAHYSFPLRMLRLVRDASMRGEAFMSIARAVHRLTGEIGDWLGIDAGTLAVGKRADVVVIDPEKLGPALDVVREAPPLDCLGGVARLVNEGGGAVRHVLVAGHDAVVDGQPAHDLGVRRGLGRVLRAA